MQKLRLLLAPMLALVMLVSGTGITLVHCSHSGRMSVLTLADLAGDDEGCLPTADCMTVSYVQQSPAHHVAPAGFDFHVLQPLLAPLPHLLAAYPPAEAFVMQRRWLLLQPVNAPPRAYLTLLSTLLI